MNGLCLSLFLLGRSAFAGPVDTFGFGARGMGWGGGGVAVESGGQGLFTSPAGLYGIEWSQASLGYTLLRSEFEPIPDVYWDTNLDTRIDDSDTPLDMGPYPEPADGFMISFAQPIGRRFAWGISAFSPRGRLIRIETFEPSLPTWILYDNRLNRYELEIGFAWQQLPGLTLGGGVEVTSRATIEIELTLGAALSGASEGDEAVADLVDAVVVDTHMVALEVEPSFAPVAAVRWDVGEVLPALDGLSLGALYRGSAGLPVVVDTNLEVDVGVSDVGDLEPMGMALLAPLQIAFTEHYIPEKIVVGVGLDWRDRLTLFADIQRTGWSGLQLSVAVAEEASLNSPIVELPADLVQDGNPYSATFVDTTGVKAGGELRLGPIRTPGAFGDVTLGIRAGWGYEPSPLASQGRGTALLDADRMVFAAGLGVRHRDPFELAAGSVGWDLFAQYHPLASGSLQVEAEPYTPGTPVGGALIPIGGHLLAGGLQLSVEY